MLHLLLATIVAVFVFIALAHGPIMSALPIPMAFGFPAGLLPAPLLPTPVFTARIVSAIVPAVVIFVSVIMGKQWHRLFAGQGWPRVIASLNGCNFSGENRA